MGSVTAVKFVDATVQAAEDRDLRLGEITQRGLLAQTPFQLRNRYEA